MLSDIKQRKEDRIKVLKAAYAISQSSVIQPFILDHLYNELGEQRFVNAVHYLSCEGLLKQKSYTDFPSANSSFNITHEGVIEAETIYLEQLNPNKEEVKRSRWNFPQ